jgi:hypothetical protein
MIDQNGITPPAPIPVIQHITKMPTLDEVEKISEPKPKRDSRGPYTTERGVILKYRKISTDVVRRAWTAIPIPKPPDVWIEDHGRYEPNPVDPGYNNEVSLYNNKVSECIQQIIMMRAVDVFSIPDGVPGPESDEWFEGLEEYFSIPNGKLARKAMWLLDYILSDTEINEIVQDISKLSGMIAEDKVDEAANSFRGDGVQETDKVLPDKT